MWKPERELERERIAVEGMSCSHCVARVRSALEGLDGVRVESVEIGEAVVSMSPGQASRDSVLAAIQSVGYTPR